MSVTIPTSTLSDALLKQYSDTVISSLKSSIMKDLFNSRGKILYETSRFIVRIASNSKIGIYDKKKNVEWRIQDVNENPRNFTPALVKRLPFFELYEKTQ